MKAVFHDLADATAAPFTAPWPADQLATPIAPGHVVLFGGNSKASAGMRNNLDRVANQLVGVATYGLGDAAFAPGLAGPE